MTAGKLSGSNAVQTARATLAAYDDGGERDSFGQFWSVTTEPAYWAGRIGGALRLVLAAIDAAEEDTP